MFKNEVMAKADEFMDIVPCKEAFVEPEKHPPPNLTEPSENYMLEYIYGYKTDDTTMNCLYSGTGKVVFYAATVGVVLDPVSNTQKFFGGISTGRKSEAIAQHTDVITSITLSLNRKFVATAQIGRYPLVYIWEAETRASKTGKPTITIGQGDTKYMPKSISAMAFSNDGAYLALADTNEEHRLYVYTTNTYEKKFMTQSQIGTVKAIAWSRKEKDNVFCTVGKKYVKYWYPFDEAKKFCVAKMPSKAMTTDFFCVAYDKNGTCYTGGANGFIYVWNSEGISPKQIQAHQGVLFALNITPDNEKLLTGGADGKVLIYKLADLSLETEHKFQSAVLSVDYATSPTRVLAGLADGAITEIQVEQENYHQILTQGHCDGYLTAIDSFEDNIITAGEDNKIIVWNYTDRNAFITSVINKNAEKGRNSGSQSKFPDNQRCKMLSVNKKTGHIALALNNGTLQIREGCYMLDNVIFKTDVSDGKQITAIKYSYDGAKLVVATVDMRVHLFDASSGSEYSKIGSFLGKDGHLIELDWSTDGGCIRGLCNTFHVQFIDPISKSIVEGNTNDNNILN